MGNLKQMFPEFFQDPINSSDLSTKTDNIIVLDTNYLLEIIKAPTIVSKQYVEAIRKVKENIYIPYLVALEFNFNKSELKKKKSQNIHNYKKEVKQKVEEIKERVEETSFINNDNKNEFTADIFKLINNFSEELQSTIEKNIDSLVTNEQESLYLQLIDIIEDRIGELYSQDWIDSIQKEGEKRFKDNIPPGFDDKNKGDSNTDIEDIRRYGEISYLRKYGDLIIWKDIINLAKSNEKGRKVIFVTDDGKSSKKNDLLYKVSGITIGPHIHLMNELYGECRKELYILNNLRFIQLVNNLSDEEVRSLKTSINTADIDLLDSLTYEQLKEFSKQKAYIKDENIRWEKIPLITPSKDDLNYINYLNNINPPHDKEDSYSYIQNLQCKKEEKNKQIRKLKQLRNQLAHLDYDMLSENDKNYLNTLLRLNFEGKGYEELRETQNENKHNSFDYEELERLNRLLTRQQDEED